MKGFFYLDLEDEEGAIFEWPTWGTNYQPIGSLVKSLSYFLE